MELERLVRLVRITLGVNVGILVLNLGVLYALLVFVVDEPATVEGVTPGESAPAQREEDPAKELASFLDRTADLVDRAARRNGVNPAEVLPTDAEMNAAIQSGSIHSEESGQVLQKLRVAYDQFGLTWPLVMPRR